MILLYKTKYEIAPISRHSKPAKMARVSLLLLPYVFELFFVTRIRVISMRSTTNIFLFGSK